MAELRSLCVYCGSSNAAAAKYLRAAFELGRLIGRAGLRLVYGGGRVGLMGRLADGALVEGGKVTGIIPRHLHDREVAHGSIDELLVVETMHERKRLMAERADGFAVLPGGFGTLDEMFEIVTWRQLGLHDKPIVLVDMDGYWGPLRSMVERIGAEGFAPAGHAALFSTVERIEELIPALGAAPPAHRAVRSERI